MHKRVARMLCKPKPTDGNARYKAMPLIEATVHFIKTYPEVAKYPSIVQLLLDHT